MTQTNDPPLISSLELIPDAAEKADLDAPNTSGGKLVIGQAPNITITQTTVVADAAERLALDVQEGDIAIQTNVSTSFIFTGGDNVANNWETLDFDAVGAIDGEDISPRDITPRDITASGNISLQDLTVAGAFNGADTSAAAAGEALTSDGIGGFSFASVGGIETAATFGDLPSINPPQIAYVENSGSYYVGKDPINLFDLDSANFIKTVSADTGSPSGMAFDNTGTKFYEGGDDEVVQYSLSTPFDISTLSLDLRLDVGDPTVNGIAWKPDGTRMVISVISPDTIKDFDLTTPYDLSTATPRATIGSASSVPRGIEFNNDGTKMFEASNNIEVFDLSTPYDITTVTNVTGVSTSENTTSVTFNNDGTLLFTTGNDSTLRQFTLSTPYDVSTASLDTSITGQDTDQRDLVFNLSGNKMFTVGLASDRIDEYTVGSGGFTLIA